MLNLLEGIGEYSRLLHKWLSLLGPLGLLFLILFGCGQKHWTQAEGHVRVLFLGNSYTFVNDMPDMFANLVREAGYSADVEVVAQGGWTLADHAASTEISKMITERT